MLSVNLIFFLINWVLLSYSLCSLFLGCIPPFNPRFNVVVSCSLKLLQDREKKYKICENAIGNLEESLGYG